MALFTNILYSIGVQMWSTKKSQGFSTYHDTISLLGPNEVSVRTTALPPAYRNPGLSIRQHQHHPRHRGNLGEQSFHPFLKIIYHIHIPNLIMFLKPPTNKSEVSLFSP